MGLGIRGRASRGTFIRAVLAAGAGVGVAAAGHADAAGTTDQPCTDTLQSILTTALAAEYLATIFYYSALTSRDLMSDSQLGGSSVDPNHPGLPPNGNPGNVRFLQAALDAEYKHVLSLRKAGGVPSVTHVYFPANTFKTNCVPGQLCTLGNSDDFNTFLGALDVLETAFVGAYLAAVRQFVLLGHPELAEVGANIVGVESEHRAIGRVIADAYPSNNLTLERLPFACVGDAAAALRPFLTGQGFAHGTTPPMPMPTEAQIARVVGNQHTHILSGYL